MRIAFVAFGLYVVIEVPLATATVPSGAMSAGNPPG